MTAVSIMWSMLLNKNYGMLSYLLGKIGIQMPNLLTSTTWAMPTVILVTVWKGFGYSIDGTVCCGSGRVAFVV